MSTYDFIMLLLHSANYIERNEYFQFKEKTFCMRVTLNCGKVKFEYGPANCFQFDQWKF